MQLYTIKDLLTLTTGYFSEIGIESPRLDAEVLLAHILGVDRIDLYVNYDRPLNKSEVDAYRRAVAERGRRRPVAYITGKREFMSLSFHVGEGVLIPRPETEILVEAVSERLKARGIAQPYILDLGTGSGCIAVTLAKEFPMGKVWAIDISPDALKVAKTNSIEHGVSDRITFLQGDLFVPLASLHEKITFDVLISNPPYIPSRDLVALAPEIREYEPQVALDGGESGLVYYERILMEGPGYLKPGGIMGLEVGAGQGQALHDKAMVFFKEVEMIRDYSGIERVLLLLT